MLLANSQGNLALQGQHLQQMADLGASGIVLYSGGFLHDEAVRALVRRKLPLVLLDRYFPSITTHVVTSDHLGGAYRATEHLLKLGHRSIGYILANTELATSTLARLEGYKAALKDYGAVFHEEMVMSAQVRPETMEVYLRRRFRPSALLASNDVRAIEVMHVLRQLGLRVPDDMALVGFDDLPIVSRLIRR